MKKVVIFGILDTADLAYYYLTHDSDYEVEAFTVSKAYLKEEKFTPRGSGKSYSVVAFEELTNIYPRDEYYLFAPMTGAKMNTLREKIFLKGKEMGYEFITYVSSKATVCDNEIGENCFILEDNTLQPFTKIGNNVVLWSGNHIGHHGEIKDHVFFTSHIVMSGHCTIESNCFIGVNATIRDFSTLKKGTLLAMGACLTKQETEEWSVYVGAPAKKLENKNSIDIY